MHRNYMINDRITGYHYQSSLKKHAYMGTVDRNYTPWFQMSAIFTSLTEQRMATIRTPRESSSAPGGGLANKALVLIP